MFRLITKNTYEYSMFHRASMKLGLDKALLTTMKDVAEGVDINDPSKFKREDVDALLRYGAYELFREDKTDAAKEYVQLSPFHLVFWLSLLTFCIYTGTRREISMRFSKRLPKPFGTTMKVPREMHPVRSPKPPSWWKMAVLCASLSS